MKKNYMILTLFVGSIAVLSMQHSSSGIYDSYKSLGHKEEAGSAAGSTGAPGESALSCTQCHTGSVLSGASENSLVVSDGSGPITAYVPGQSYTVSVSMASNPSKKGFQATALDAGTNMAGNFTALSGTSINGTTRKYANHTSTSNTSATTVWTWTWTAPATDVGPVTFYLATNSADNSGTKFGDEIYLSQHTIDNFVGIEEVKNEKTILNASYNAANQAINLTFNHQTSGKVFLNLVDSKGNSVYHAQIGESVSGLNKISTYIPVPLTKGMYMAHLFIGNTPMLSKFIVH